MQLVMFQGDSSPRLGVLLGGADADTIADLQLLDPQLPGDVVAFLAGGAAVRQQVEQALSNVSPAVTVQREAVTLLAPIPRPGKIICIGLNYRDHAAESNAPIPEYPTVFSKYANTIIATGDPIVLPGITQQVDYEGELAVVIGTRAKSVSEAEALQFVGGYANFNDVSARDFQNRTTQWTIGKTFDTFGPFGPAVVTADEVPDPHNLDLTLTINGEVLQHSNTRHLIFGIPFLVSYLSAVMTLEPGDVIITGTPAGVGFARKPPRWLRAGDEVQVAITGLGVLTNPVVDRQSV